MLTPPIPRSARASHLRAGALAAPGTARSLGALSVSCIAGASAIAALAGHTMVAWWMIACLVPLVTPVTFAYAIELSLWHGLLIVPVLAGLGIVLGLAAFGRAIAALDEL
jgi:hypothetical protein